MPEYLSPGVYVEEVDKGTKPIEGAGTACAAFVGFAEQGPVNEPVFIPNWTEFTNTFGGFVEGSYLALPISPPDILQSPQLHRDSFRMRFSDNLN